MSDFGNEQPPLPPAAPAAFAPPSAGGPSPFGSYGTPGNFAGAVPQQYAPGSYQPPMQPAGKPPRPKVVLGSLLLVGGGALSIAASYMTWLTAYGASFDGFTASATRSSQGGPVFVFLGGVAVAFGITQLAARKVLAVGIVAIVFALLGLLAVLAKWRAYSSDLDISRAAGFGGSYGVGMWLLILANLVVLVGSIATVAKPRR